MAPSQEQQTRKEATTNGGGAGDSSSSSNPSRDQEPEARVLGKLQDMVPTMPKDRELSRLEIINHVCDYIKHLGGQIEEDNKKGNGKE